MNHLKDEKLMTLQRQIRAYPPFVIAFSGGVDSSFLAAVSYQIRKGDVVAMTADSPFMSQLDRDYACKIAADIGIQHEMVAVDLLGEPQIIHNSETRCYHCKRFIFKALKQRAAEFGLSRIAHGVNLDDLDEFRPGLRAADEMGILSPLVAARLTKAEIRRASKKMDLQSWNIPSQSCLATRIPMGEPITRKDLVRIDACEAHLRRLGFPGVRVRCYGDTARIEVPFQMISQFAEDEMRQRIIHFFKTRHFKYIALDLEGYQSGSL